MQPSFAFLLPIGGQDRQSLISGEVFLYPLPHCLFHATPTADNAETSPTFKSMPSTASAQRPNRLIRISVVTAVYNRASTIGHAMETVQAQTYPNIEHVIQDGGSTDGTLEILHLKAQVNTLIHSAPDNGIYDAINKGIEATTGDVIGLMHSDDFFADDTVLEDVAKIFADPAIDGVYGDLQYVAADNTDRIIRYWKSRPYALTKLQRGWMPPHPTVYLRRGVFERLGLYDTSYRIAADYDAMLRYMARGGIHMAYLPRVMVKMRVGGESNRSLKLVLRKSREDYRALRSNGVGGAGALAMKNLSKIGQFIRRGSRHPR